MTVTGVDDALRDGDKRFTILVKPAQSADPRFNGLDGDDVEVVNQDDEASFSFDGDFPLAFPARYCVHLWLRDSHIGVYAILKTCSGALRPPAE